MFQHLVTSALTPVTDPIALVAVGLVLCAIIATVLRRKVRPAVARACRALVTWLRPHLPARVRRVARKCSDRIDAEVVRSVLVTGVAGGIAWTAADILNLVGPVTAAISATLSVQLSSHASLREGTQRLVATVAGIAVAVGVWKMFGLNPWSIAVIAAAGLAAGRLLRLGDGSVAVPATSLGILVAASSVTEAFVWQRVATTALGIVVGGILSPLVSGMTPLERARAELAHLSTEIGLLLGHLGKGVRNGYDREQAAHWLARSRELEEDRADAVKAVEDLTKQARWSFTTPVGKVTPLRQTLRALDHGVHQVNSVARTMFDAAASPQNAGVPGEIGQVLMAAAEAFAAHAVLVSDRQTDATEDADHLNHLVDDLIESRRETVRKVRTAIDDTGVLVLTGSIITDIDRMAGSLARSAPALAVGEPEPETGIPAVCEVMPAMRRMWDKRRDHLAAEEKRRRRTRGAAAKVKSMSRVRKAAA